MSSSLSVIGEMEVNPTLLHVLKVDFGCEVDQAALDDAHPGRQRSMSRGSCRKPTVDPRAGAAGTGLPG